MDEKKVSPDPSNGADLVAGAILGTFWLCILLRATLAAGPTQPLTLPTIMPLT